MQFLTKSQLRQYKQPYIVALFQNLDDDEQAQIDKLTTLLNGFYNQIQSCFTQVYCIVCIQNVSAKRQSFIDKM